MKDSRNSLSPRGGAFRPALRWSAPLWAAAVVGALFVASASLAQADAGGSGRWADGSHARARLIAATAGAADAQGHVRLALEIETEPGWKTYWRHAGDTGLPPRLDWSRSENLKSLAPRWPAPTRYDAFGYDYFGYRDGLVLPVAGVVADPSAPTQVRLDIDYAVCSDICVPERASLALTLPGRVDSGSGDSGSGAAATVFEEKIAAAEARAPTRDPAVAGVDLTDAVLRGDGDDAALEVRLTGPVDAPDLFVEGPEGASFGRPAVTPTPDGALLRLALQAGDPAEIAAAPLTLTLVDGDRGLEKALTVRRAD